MRLGLNKLIGSLIIISFFINSDHLRAEPFSSAVEISKLSEIVIQMTQLLEKTESLIGIQEAVERNQGRSLFRKLHGNSKQLIDLLDLAGIDKREEGNKLLRIIELSESIHQLARQLDDYQAREGLYLIADGLRLVIEASLLVDETEKILKQTHSSNQFNSQDQLLAGMRHDLARMNLNNNNRDFDQSIDHLHRRQTMLAGYRVFSK